MDGSLDEEAFVSEAGIGSGDGFGDGGGAGGAAAKQLADMNLDLAQWQPLIADKQFLPWLVKNPDEKAQVRAKSLTYAQANRLEELWKTNPNAGLDDADTLDLDEELQPVALRYADAYQYQNVFGEFIFILVLAM